MAAPPKKYNLSQEDIPDAPPWFSKLLEANGPFVGQTNTALAKGLTFGENFASETKTVSFVAPTRTFRAPTLVNSWVDFGGSEQPTGYRIDEGGCVYLRGLPKNGTAVGTILFTLPAGYRPTANENFVVISNGAVGYVGINASGNVTLASGSTAWVSLAGISFQAATPAPPDAPGAPFPLSVSHGLSDVAGLLVLASSCRSLAAGSICGVPSFQWEKGQASNVLLRDVHGLVPGQTYDVTLLLVSG